MDDRETDIVRWEDGSHEILAYNDDNGYGLTRCGAGIGPWDVWLCGEVTCVKCLRAAARAETERAHEKEKGPKDWFPKDPEQKPAQA